MMSSLKMEVLVVGGTGSIGSAIVRELYTTGYGVTVMSRGKHPFNKDDVVEQVTGAKRTLALREVHCDVTNRRSVHYCHRKHFGLSRHLAGIVYTVGHGPPGGFDEEISVPLSELADVHFTNELTRHVTGLFNVVSQYRRSLRDRGHIIVIGSAITRLTDDTCPPWLHAGHYATAKAAQAELVRWLRRDPNLKGKNILVHHLAPAAVDTPFHRGCMHQPPALLSVTQVARRVLDAMESTTPLDEMMIPQPSA